MRGKLFRGQKGIFVYEAGPTGYGLYDYLREQGEGCEVAVPSMIPKAPGERVKTNRLDAINLGIQLRTNGLRKVHVPEKKYRDLRHLTRLHLKYSRRIIATKNSLRGLYLFEGIKFPEGRWSRRLVSKLEGISHRTAVDFTVKQLVANLQFFQLQELKTKGEIRRFCRADEEIKRCILFLMSLPGVGWMVATYTLGALGGYKHLTSTKGTSGFLGFGPRENSTGEKVKKGNITAIGDPNARKMIIQGCWAGIKKDPQLRVEFDKIFFRHNEKIRAQKAIVAVGRKMICRIHAVLRDQRFFEKKINKGCFKQKETSPRDRLVSRRV